MEPPNTRKRVSIRLKGYDYAEEGAYFVTICTQDGKCLFGKVFDGKMMLNKAGKIVCDEWVKTAILRPNVTCHAFVIMPNHLHGIINIDESRTGVLQYAPTQHGGRGVLPYAPTHHNGNDKKSTLRSPSQTLGAIVRGFKSAVTKRINESQKTPGLKIWQRNYHEHIIRDQNDFIRIYEYIENNPLRWELDSLHPTFGKQNG